MISRKSILGSFLVALLVAGCGEDGSQTPLTPDFARPGTVNVCDPGDGAKDASDYFLDNGQRRRVKARLADLAGYCDGGNAAQAMEAAAVQAFEMELALDPSNPQAGDPVAGSRFLNVVLRLSGWNCTDGNPCSDENAPNYLPDVDFAGVLDPAADAAFGVRPIPVDDGLAGGGLPAGFEVEETLAVVSRHADASLRWAVEPQSPGQPKSGAGFTTGTWTATLGSLPSILYGQDPDNGSATAFDWGVFPVVDFAEEILMTYCGVDAGQLQLAGFDGIVTREGNGLQQGTAKEAEPGFCGGASGTDPYFGGLYSGFLGPIEVALAEPLGPRSLGVFASDAFRTVGRWLSQRTEELITPQPINAVAIVNPGPRGTGLSSGFSLFDGAVVQPETAQLQFESIPCDGTTGEPIVCGTDAGGDYSVKVRAFILDQYGNELEFERLQITMTVANNNGTNGYLDGGAVNLCLGEPVPWSTDPAVPCAATTEESGVATFRGLTIASESDNTNAANGGYEFIATAVGPPGTFGYSVASATSLKFQINPN